MSPSGTEQTPDATPLDILLGKITGTFTSDELHNPSDETFQRITDFSRNAIQEINELAAAEPINEPTLIIERIVSQYRTRDPYAAKPITNLDQVVSRYGLNLKRFRAVGLSAYDEMCLLKASVIAGMSRDTMQGSVLARQAISLIRAEANNIGMLSMNPVKDVATQTVLTRSIYAFGALGDIYQRDEQLAPTSVDAVLHEWNLSLARRDDEIHTDEPLESEIHYDPESRVGFRRLLKMEANERMQGLQLIGESLLNAPDKYISLRYFETVVFENKDAILAAPESEHEATDTEEQTHNPDGIPHLTPDYVLTEITERLPDDTVQVHVVAESPIYGNACYVLRGDTLAALSATLDEPLVWQEVLSYPKVTARQLGATRFHHVQGSNVPERVLAYFDKDLSDTLRPIAERWFVEPKPMYDLSLEVTQHNRLPLRIVENLQSKIADVHEQMMEWLGEARRRPATSQALGRQALEEQLVRNEQLNTENQRLVQENEALKARLKHAIEVLGKDL